MQCRICGGVKPARVDRECSMVAITHSHMAQGFTAVIDDSSHSRQKHEACVAVPAIDRTNLFGAGAPFTEETDIVAAALTVWAGNQAMAQMCHPHNKEFPARLLRTIQGEATTVRISGLLQAARENRCLRLMLGGRSFHPVENAVGMLDVPPQNQSAARNETTQQ